jgi:hypothetical protein
LPCLPGVLPQQAGVALQVSQRKTFAQARGRALSTAWLDAWSPLYFTLPALLQARLLAAPCLLPMLALQPALHVSGVAGSVLMGPWLILPGADVDAVEPLGVSRQHPLVTSCN